MLKKKLKVSQILYLCFGGTSNLVFSLIQQNNHRIYEESLIFTGLKFLKEYKKKANTLNINFLSFRIIMKKTFIC